MITRLNPTFDKYRWLLWLLIALIVLLPRMLDLDVFYARDELAIWPWADEFTLAIWAGDLDGTLTVSDYPGIPAFWTQTAFLSLKYGLPSLFPATLIPLDSLFDGRTLPLLAERRFALAVFGGLLILGSVWGVKRLLGWPAAILSAILVGLDPFSLTESRLLRVEMTSALFATLSVMLYLVYFRERRWTWLLASGAMAGLSVSSKTSGGLIVPFIWLLLLFDFLVSQRDGLQPAFKRMIGNGLIWAGGAIAAFWIIWPAMWVVPVEALTYLFEAGLRQAADQSVWHGDVFFWGQTIPNDPGVWFYPVALAFRTTPLTWLGVIAALVLMAQAGRKLFTLDADSPHWPATLALLLLSYVILMIVELTFVISKVDRFLMLILPALNIVAAIGLMAILAWLVDRATTSRAVTAGTALALILAAQLVITIPAHPYYFTYWNPLVGGGQTAMRTVPIGAGEGIDQGVAYLNALPAAAETSLICGASQPWCDRLFAGETLRYATYFDGSWVEADYASFYISQLQREEYPPEIIDFFLARPAEHEVTMLGATYMWLFEVPEIEQFAGYNNRLAGAGQLLGYTLAASEVERGSSLDAEIWWTNLGAGPDALVVRLLDETGYEWSRARVTPYTEYAAIPADQRAIIAGTAALDIPAAMPPGLYFLRVGVMQDGSLAGEFSMPDAGSQIAVQGQPTDLDPQQLDIATRLDAQLAPEVTLLGVTPPAQVINSEQPAWLSLFWQAEAAPQPYQVRLRLLDGAGEEVTRWQGTPRYPTEAWQTGEIVQNVWPLQVAADVSPGQYALEIALLDGDALAGEVIMLDNIEVWPQPVSYDVPEMQVTLNAPVDGQVTLLGYDLYFDTAGGSAGLFAPVFHWRSEADFQQAYTLDLTLKAADSGQPLQTWQVPLGEGRTLWKAGEIVTTPYQFDASAMIGGAYDLDVAVAGQTIATIKDVQDKIVVRVD